MPGINQSALLWMGGGAGSGWLGRQCWLVGWSGLALCESSLTSYCLSDCLSTAVTFAVGWRELRGFFVMCILLNVF